jgi:hypothetical protein
VDVRLVQLAEDAFVAAGPERVAGLRIGTRMTVIRLSDGRVLLHSPIPRDAELVREIEALGPVAFLVAPNKVHHLWLGAWAGAHADATVYGAPGLREKRRDLVFHRELGDEPPPDWARDLDQTWIAGAPYVNEVAFLHRASGSLLLTDFAMNFPVLPAGAGTRLWLRAMGLAGGLRCSRLVRSLVRDRAAVRKSLERILAWPFERVIVTHGQVLERGGPAALRAAWRSLLA